MPQSKKRAYLDPYEILQFASGWVGLKSTLRANRTYEDRGFKYRNKPVNKARECARRRRQMASNQGGI